MQYVNSAGHPLAKLRSEQCKAFMATLTEDDMRKIIERMISNAKAGSLEAAQALLDLEIFDMSGYDPVKYKKMPHQIPLNIEPGRFTSAGKS